MRKLLAFIAVILLAVLSACSGKGDNENDRMYIYEVKDGSAVITGYRGYKTKLDIPSELGGYTVTAIAENAFNGFVNLTEVVIPNTVTDIHGAFRYCDKLKYVTIGSGVRNAEGAFELCTALEQVQGGENIENLNNTFKQCINLISGVIPPTCTTADGTFENCTALSSVLIEGNIDSLDRTFYCCEKITSVHIPSSVTTLYESFYGCVALNSVTGGENVTSYDFSFGDCISLTNLTLGTEITVLKNAFNGCLALSELNGMPQEVVEYSPSFNNCRSLKSITIPNIKDEKSLEEYNPTEDFKGCGALENIQINCVFTVKEEFCKMFSGCMSLKNVTVKEELTESLLRPSYVYDDSLFSGEDKRIDKNLKNAKSKKTVRVTDDYGYVEDISYTHIYGYDLDTIDAEKVAKECSVKGFIPFDRMSYWFGYPKSGSRVNDTVALVRTYHFRLRTTGQADGTLPATLIINGAECAVGNG